MKLFILLAFSMLSFHFQSSAQSSPKTQEIIIKTEVFCNHCDHCETCKPQIETALFQVFGVKQAKLNIAEQNIKVVFNPKKTSPEDIKKAILESGYSADGAQPTSQAQSKLEACCQRK